MRVTAQLHGTKPLTIPPHLTSELQPLDVCFFRQLTIFIRRMTEEALVNKRVGEITSREGIINLMSIIYDQLQSPAYHDLCRYSWRHTDPNFSPGESSNYPPANRLRRDGDFRPQFCRDFCGERFGASCDVARDAPPQTFANLRLSASSGHRSLAASGDDLADRLTRHAHISGELRF